MNLEKPTMECPRCGERLYIGAFGNRWEWNDRHKGFKAHIFFCGGINGRKKEEE